MGAKGEKGGPGDGQPGPEGNTDVPGQVEPVEEVEEMDEPLQVDPEGNKEDEPVQVFPLTDPDQEAMLPSNFTPQGDRARQNGIKVTLLTIWTIIYKSITPNIEYCCFSYRSNL